MPVGSNLAKESNGRNVDTRSARRVSGIPSEFLMMSQPLSGPSIMSLFLSVSHHCNVVHNRFGEHDVLAFGCQEIQ